MTTKAMAPSKLRMDFHSFRSHLDGRMDHLMFHDVDITLAPISASDGIISHADHFSRLEQALSEAADDSWKRLLGPGLWRQSTRAHIDRSLQAISLAYEDEIPENVAEEVLLSASCYENSLWRLPFKGLLQGSNLFPYVWAGAKQPDL
ncbi:hypothetical protein I302_104030 [Kwoniella bestiolae CBS 10118]|uniref:Uncharacterized protein n=1 Tax=Kwoniella bestiolae CBS 10118 TaxID=1296100 RepID=A0A1B9GA46_9TREE|nr:hypothetical protein I302_02735 [Kwoniella bestiolae CBS 10118]OCF27885.1 hypothetical protein I302_02735 [Kwoniella bestiolae CBS 10118]